MKYSRYKEFIGKHNYDCWCGGDRYKVFSANLKGSYPYVALQCEDCGTQRILPRALSDDLHADLLYNTVKLSEPNSEDIDHGARKCLDRLLSTGAIFNQNELILDVGCGYGKLLDLISQKYGCLGQGIDTDSRKINWAKSHNTANVDYLCELFNPNKLSERYDKVISCAVIEHVINPTDFIQQLIKVLKPGGSLFLLTPNSDSINYYILKSWWRELLSLGEHIYLFTPDSLERCASGSGLSMVATKCDYDYAKPMIDFSTKRNTLVTAWSCYREFIKRVTSIASGKHRGDILTAHFRKA